MKRWLYIAGALVTALCVVFFAGRVVEHWQTLRDMTLQASVFPMMAIATALYIASYFSASRSWHIMLRALGQPVGLGQSIRITMTAQFAKFIPGNVGQHIGRVVLAVRAGASGKAATASVLLDMLALAVAGALLSLFQIETALALANHHAGDSSSIALRATLIMVISAVFALVMHVLVRRYAPSGHARLVDGLVNLRAQLSRRSPLDAVHAITCHCISFALGAVAITLIARSIAHLDSVHFLGVLGAYALAWMAGFLLPGAPAGIGVREFVMLLTMTPYFGEQTATATTVLFRIVTTLGDGVAFLIGLGMRKADRAANPGETGT